MKSRKPIWSILVPTHGDRLQRFAVSLIENLSKQIQSDEVELVVLHDLGKRTIGGKRNALMHIAIGQFISFIDDDDLISPRYVSAILEAIKEHPDTDVIMFDVLRRTLGNQDILCKHDPGIMAPGYFEDGKWLGIPSHLMVWRAELARSSMFPNIDFGEDYEWMVNMKDKIQSCHNIEETLYSYECGRASLPKDIYSSMGDPFAS